MSPARRGWSCALLTAALTCACGSSGHPPSTVTTLEVYSWLTSGSERDALNALFDVIRRENTGLAITNAAQDRSDVAQQELATRMSQSNPPDSFQVVSGSDLDSWVNKGALESLDALARSEGWGSVIPAPVLDSVSKNGTLYGVPLDIERDNTLFYNKQIFADLRLPPPVGVGDVVSIADALKNKGIAPLSVSAATGWTIASMLFEAILVAQAGPDFYQAYLSGQKTADTPELRMALGTLGEWMEYANADRTSTKWPDAVASVCRGDAAMLILPDFVKGELAHDGCGPEKIGYVPMQPAGTPTFIFVSIAFELPNGAPHRQAAIDFLRTAGSKAGQEAFNPIKGSIPARTDANPALFDAISAQTLADFRANGEHLAPAYAALTSPIFQAAVNPALKSFVDPASDAFKNVETVITVLTQKYGMIHEP
jgi:glucose/mannose transport system substrate-binding protein